MNMSIQEYKEKVAQANKQHQAQLLMIYKQYAFTNNPYPMDTIIGDNSHLIQIKEIHVSMHSTLPTCTYTGIELCSDGFTPKKKQTGYHVFQGAVTRVRC